MPINLLPTAPELDALVQIGLFVGLAFGILSCFAGYTAWRFILGTFGFALGQFVGILVGLLLAQQTQSPHPIWIAAILGAVGGATLLAAVMPLGTFVVSGWWAFGLAYVLLAAAGAPPEVSMGAGIIGGLLVGILAAVSGKTGIIIVSGVSGGTGILVTGILLLQINKVSLGRFDSIEPALQELLVWGMGIALGFGGMAIQFILTSPLPKAPSGTALGDSAASASPRGASDEAQERLHGLADLRQRGLITEGEFQSKRQEVLAKL